MVDTPFDGAARGYGKLGPSFADIGDRFATLQADIEGSMQGESATSIQGLIGDYRQRMVELSDHTTEMVTTCVVQADADHRLMAAPSPADVEDQRDRLRAANRLGSVAQALHEGEKLREISSARDDAYVKHMNDTFVTEPKIVPVEPKTNWRRGSGKNANTAATGEDGVSLMPLNRPSSGVGGGGGGGGMPSLPPMSMANIGTHTSGDVAGAARSATPMPPQMQPMTGMSGGAPAGGGMPVGMGAMPGGMPNMQPMSMSKRDKKKDELPTYLSGADGAAAGSGLGAAAGVAAGQVDRGSSVTGVSTRADVSGRGSGAVAATPPPSGSGGSGSGRMMGGPMGMGGLGGGNSLHQQNGKARPDIPNRDPDLVGQGAADAAVQGGIVGRASSKSPDPDFGDQPEPSSRGSDNGKN